jgi:YrbI family 3-deoxy-D-manno-octulosonate 8-phosphate phosphatase
VIQTVLLDIDGVLTDGTVWVDSEGREIKRLSFSDIDAIFELKRAGIKVGFITGERNSFCRYVRRRFHPDFFLTGCKDKLACFRRLLLETGLDERSVCYVGDSRKDIELLRDVAHSFAPADTDWLVRRAAKIVLQASRGQGVIREVADRILGKHDMEESGSGQQKKKRYSAGLETHIISGAGRKKRYQNGGVAKKAAGRKQLRHGRSL